MTAPWVIGQNAPSYDPHVTQISLNQKSQRRHDSCLQDNDRQGQNRQGAVLSTGRQQLRTTRPQPKDPKRPTKFGHQETFL